MTVVNMAQFKLDTARAFEIASRNQLNYNRWRIRWGEYHDMLEYEDEYSAYQLMTGRGYWEDIRQ